MVKGEALRRVEARQDDCLAVGKGAGTETTGTAHARAKARDAPFDAREDGASADLKLIDQRIGQGLNRAIDDDHVIGRALTWPLASGPVTILMPA